MTRALAIAATLTGAIAVLSLVDERERVWWFRGYVVLVALLAIRVLVRWLDTQPRGARRPRRRWPWHRPPPVTTRHGSDRMLHLATFSAGDAHRGLRPVVREIADERLRARYGIGVDDPAAAAHVAPATWELVRPDRSIPHDLRAPGLSPSELDALLTDLEAL